MIKSYFVILKTTSQGQQMKMTSNGKQHQDIKSVISQQPLREGLNKEINKLGGIFHLSKVKMSSNRRQPPNI